MGEHQRILVTDSGLGGLSVFAGVARNLEQSSPWPRVSMIYFNAWPEEKRGYNHFPDMEMRARVFNNALNAMAAYGPDTLAIACNTLSVIYPFTSFSKTTGIPVRGIVQDGINLILAHMTDPDSVLILFGTPTTISTRTHWKILTAGGMDPSRIVEQGCVNLAGKIERTPFSGEVDQMIRENVAQAVSRLDKKGGRVHAALCCTHFGYRKDCFREAFESLTDRDVVILDPNERMAGQIAGTGRAGIRAAIDMTIVSRIPWEPERISAYHDLFATVSPATAQALERYQLKPDLFAVEPAQDPNRAEPLKEIQIKSNTNSSL